MPIETKVVALTPDEKELANHIEPLLRLFPYKNRPPHLERSIFDTIKKPTGDELFKTDGISMETVKATCELLRNAIVAGQVDLKKREGKLPRYVVGLRLAQQGVMQALLEALEPVLEPVVQHPTRAENLKSAIGQRAQEMSAMPARRPKSLYMYDGSGSMRGQPIDFARAVGRYLSPRPNTAVWQVAESERRFVVTNVESLYSSFLGGGSDWGPHITAAINAVDDNSKILFVTDGVIPVKSDLIRGIGHILKARRIALTIAILDCDERGIEHVTKEWADTDVLIIGVPLNADPAGIARFAM